MNTNMYRAGSYPLWGTDCRPCDGGCGSGGRSSVRCVEEDCSPSDHVPTCDLKRNSRQCAGKQILVLYLNVSKGCEHSKCVCLMQVESLQKECSIRAQFWSQQRVKEEELVANLHKALQNCLYTALQEESDHVRLTACSINERWH